MVYDSEKNKKTRKVLDIKFFCICPSKAARPEAKNSYVSSEKFSIHFFTGNDSQWSKILKKVKKMDIELFCILPL